MFSFGSDPEFMLMRGKKFVSAIGIVPGTKEKHYRINGNSYYYDNVLAECTIVPSESKEGLIANVRKGLQQFATLVHPNKLVCQASAIYGDDQLKHKDAIAIGCTPETCAYTLTDPPAPEDVMKSTGLRSAGGHIHIGNKFCQDAINCVRVIRMMDLFIGIPSVFIDHDRTSKRRKELYGKAGRYRKPKWGAEYRSLSNFWLTRPKMTELVYDLTGFAVDFCESGQDLKLWNIDEKRLRDDDSWNDPDYDPVKCHVCVGYDVASLRCAIDNMDKVRAAVFMTMIKDIIPSNLYSRIAELQDDKEKYDLYTEWGINA